MKQNTLVLAKWQMAALAIVFVLGGLPERAYCEPDGPVLLLQQSPPESGRITPGVGVHHFRANATVTLTAAANPGYQFVLWMGDVSDATANSTTVYLDAPKIVIAVFERAQHTFLGADLLSASIPGSDGGSSAYTSGDYSRRGGGSGGGSAGRNPGSAPDPNPSDDYQVPGHTPEPATGAMLLLGALLTFLRPRHRARPA